SIVASGMAQGQGQRQRAPHGHQHSGRTWPSFFGGGREPISEQPSLRRPSKNPPPLPPQARKGKPTERGSDDLTRAWSEAIASAAVDARPGHPQGDTWKPAEGVVFEDGPPQLSGGAAGADAPPQAERDPGTARRPARRLPEVEDFPPVGQREYRAKKM